jgi:hypothetical protein
LPSSCNSHTRVRNWGFFADRTATRIRAEGRAHHFDVSVRDDTGKCQQAVSQELSKQAGSARLEKRQRTHSSSETSRALSLRFMLGLNFALPELVPALADGLNSLVLPSKPPTGRSRIVPTPGGPIEGVLAKRPTLGARVEPTPTEGTLRTPAAARAGLSPPPLPPDASFGASSVAPGGGAGVDSAVLEARDEAAERSGAGEGDGPAPPAAVMAAAPDRVWAATRRPLPLPLPDMVSRV